MGWGEGLDLCALENAPGTRKCPETSVHNCLKRRWEEKRQFWVFFKFFFITSIAVRKEKHNTWTHGLLWSISMHAKVPGGCRLQFKQIARDVQCRNPSSKDDIMRSSWFYCYSNCDKLDVTVCNCFNSCEKKTVPTVPNHLLCRFNLLRTDVILCKIFWIWTGNRPANFQVKTGGEVGKFWTYEVPIISSLNMN